MKNNLLLSTVLCAVLLISCEKNEDNPTTENSDNKRITNTWNLTDFHAENALFTINYLGKKIPIPITCTGSDYDVILLFKDAPKTVNSEGDFTVTVSGSFMGQKRNGSFSSDLFMKNLFLGSWKISEDKLIVEKDGESNTFDIESLTKNTLKLKLDISHQISNDGIEGTVTAKIVLTFTP